jgi:hypothetical protein
MSTDRKFGPADPDIVKQQLAEMSKKEFEEIKWLVSDEIGRRDYPDPAKLQDKEYLDWQTHQLRSGDRERQRQAEDARKAQAVAQRRNRYGGA